MLRAFTDNSEQKLLDYFGFRKAAIGLGWSLEKDNVCEAVKIESARQEAAKLESTRKIRK